MLRPECQVRCFFVKVYHHSLVLSLAYLIRVRGGLVLCPLTFAPLVGKMP